MRIWHLEDAEDAASDIALSVHARNPDPCYSYVKMATANYIKDRLRKAERRYYFESLDTWAFSCVDDVEERGGEVKDALLRDGGYGAIDFIVSISQGLTPASKRALVSEADGTKGSARCMRHKAKVKVRRMMDSWNQN